MINVEQLIVINKTLNSNKEKLLKKGGRKIDELEKKFFFLMN